MAAIKKRRTPKGVAAGLTVEQEAYCRGRALGMSVEEALAAANIGVTAATARKWEKVNGEVAGRIDELVAIAQKNAILKSGLDREWVISRLMTLAERCMQAEPVRDRDGNAIGEYQFNATGANQALRALGDVIGLFRPVPEKPGEEFEHLSDAELARVAAGLAAQSGLLESLAGTQAPPGSKPAGALPALPKAD